MIGICAYGAYIPRLRLSRKSIVQHIGWRAPGLAGLGQGERAMCNWDEDSVTMAVAAARDCLVGFDKAQVDSIYMATTTPPFLDRLNAGIVAAAVNLREDIAAADFSLCQRAGTSALLAAVDAVKSGSKKNLLVTAADKRDPKPASTQEMLFGDGAAALLLGSENVVAEFKGAYSVSCDFVDHYRGPHHVFDYTWEERWVRDEGYMKIVPQAIKGLLAKLDLTLDKVSKLVYCCPKKGDHASIAKTLGAAPANVADNMFSTCGETGTAHPLVMLVSALEQAKPGDIIVVAGFGQGCDALCFQVTENLIKLAPRNGVAGSLQHRKATDNYTKYLVFRDLLPTEGGLRVDAPTQTALTTLWRRRKTILGLIGGRCQQCGTPQFPMMNICVNPDCGAIDKYDEYPFSDMPAKVKSFTADSLAATVDPPQIFGIVQFDGGGRFIADFTDCETEELKVGLPVQMSFRKRLSDPQHGFSGYFWKAVPVNSAGNA